MLSLTLRQIQILDHLLRNEISHVDDLLSYVKISSRTLQSNISMINSELLKNGLTFAINTNHNHGYSIEPNADNHLAYDHLKAQCESYLDNEITCKYGDNPRISYLVRAFLCTDDFMKAEDLVDVLNISLATLTNDMRLVRNIFEKYQIILQSIPYYGMKVVGEPYAIRSCLLDFCDIYNGYNTDFYFEQVSLKQYNIEISSIATIRKLLIEELHTHQIDLSERGFRRVLFYLLIKYGGYDHFPLEDNHRLIRDGQELACAKSLTSQLAIYGEGETHFLAILMLSSQDHLSDEEIKASTLGDAIEDLLVKLIHSLMSEIHLDIRKKPQIIKVLRSFIYSFLIRKNHHIYEYNGSMKMQEIVRDLPVSCSLSNTILELLCFFTGYAYDLYHNSNLTMSLFNTIFIVHNEYEPVRVAYIGNFKKESSISVAERLIMTERYNIVKEFFSFYESETLDWGKYDCAFLVEGCGLQIKNCTIPLFDLNFFIKENQQKNFFDQILARKRIENFLVYKADNKVEIEVANKNHKYINEIVEVLGNYGYTSILGQKVIENLIHDNVGYYQFDPFVICLMWHCELQHTLFVFNLKTPEKMNDFVMRTIKIVVMDPNDNVLAIKQADSYVRRMQRSAVL